MLDTLAVGYAAVGRFEEAARSEDKARQLAENTGRAELAAALAGRLEMFRQRRPFVEEAAPAPPSP
ncbi:MAG: hypothetical protein NTW86_23820 [Candidatus Sumerlaeota bacterium]|nr:hypothetical protein [Candidatus Sumerlaeota bacterium]